MAKPKSEWGKPGRPKGSVSGRKDKSCATVPLTPEMASLLLDTSDLRKRVMLGLFLQNGLRVGEVVTIKWGTLLEAARGKMSKVMIPKQSRGGKTVFREVVLRKELVEDVQKFYMGQKADEYVFTALRTNDLSLKKKPLSPTGFNKILKQEMKAKGIEPGGNISSHMLRKTFGVALLEAFKSKGYSELEALFAVKDVYGHRSIETTRVYVGMKREANLEAISEINFYARQTT